MAGSFCATSDQPSWKSSECAKGHPTQPSDAANPHGGPLILRVSAAHVWLIDPWIGERLCARRCRQTDARKKTAFPLYSARPRVSLAFGQTTFRRVLPRNPPRGPSCGPTADLVVRLMESTPRPRTGSQSRGGPDRRRNHPGGQATPGPAGRVRLCRDPRIGNGTNSFESSQRDSTRPQTDSPPRR